MSALLLILAALAVVHGDTRSTAVLRPGESAWTLQVEVDADRALQTVGLDRPDGTRWTPSEVQEQEAAVLAEVQQHLRLAIDGHAWEPSPLRVDLIEALDPLFGLDSSLRLVLYYSLRPPSSDVQLRVEHDLFSAAETAHQHRFRWEPGEGPAVDWAVFVGSPLLLDLEDPTPLGRVLRRERYFFDGLNAARQSLWPLLFLLVAGLGATSLLRVLGIGAGFLAATAAGATLAAMDLVEPSLALLALAVPFSVAYVAAENRFSADRKLRWASSTLFGFVFGLLLDTALRDHGLPGLDRRGCALAFTVGSLTFLVGAFLALAPVIRLLSSEFRVARGLRVGIDLAALLLGTASLLRALI